MYLLGLLDVYGMRPLILSPLFSSIESLSFVGDKTAQRFHKFGKERVLDLLWALPTHLEIRTFYDNLNQSPSKTLVSCMVTVREHLPPAKRHHPYRILCDQGGNAFSLLFFHAQKPYLQQALPIGEQRLISGLMERTSSGPQMVHPDYVGKIESKVEWEGPSPLYALTAGISQNIYRKILRNALTRIPDLPEWIPSAILDSHQWPSWKAAMLAVHRPLQESDLLPSSKNKSRLAFDEFLAYQIGLALFRKKCLKKTGQHFEGTGKIISVVRNKLPFQLTHAQESVLKTLYVDLESTYPMMRLLQGDVGSGKTIVALLAMLQVVESGAQCAFLAPTEILAQQHYETLCNFLEGTDVKVCLLTGKISKKEKDILKQQVEEGHLQIVIGTHALLEEDIIFPRLGFVVIDEQHRFGVEQRQRLITKGQGVNVLVMSATPIPRSLALTLYGDLDISLLKEKPKNRLPIQTKVLSLDRLLEVHTALKRAVEEGQKIYWVCPLIEESEAMDLGHTKARVDILKKVLGVNKVAWMHGRMTREEKEQSIQNFKNGECAVLVSTTVIEVGIDIPDATIMIIEHAERFGLAQLHQLRGRVGRGNRSSTCLLLYGKKLSEAGKKRLEIMRSTEDGFLIAEEDLKLRGAGDLLGTRQSGLPDFRVASVEDQGELLKEAYFLARELIENKQTISEEQPLTLLLSLFERRL